MLVQCCICGQEDATEIAEAPALPILDPHVSASPEEFGLFVLPVDGLQVEAPDFGSFTIEVDLIGQNLGVTLDTAGDYGPMIKGIQAGAVHDYNQLHPDRAVRKFDRIHSMDEAQGTAAIFRHIKGGKLKEIETLCILRPRTFVASITKTGDLGVLLDYNRHSLGLVVRQVLNDGHVAEWNKVHIQDAFSEGDRLFELNGESLSGEAMLEEIRASKTLLFTVLKYPKPPEAPKQ